MQNTAIIACAGAGKTYSICSRALSKDEPSLMITYTNRGKDAIKKQVLALNHGIESSRITVETWFEFLLREIIRPYQTLLNTKLSMPNRIVSIDFSNSHDVNYRPQGFERWVTQDGRFIRQNEVATMALALLNTEGNLIFRRLRQQFAYVFVDEFQDLAGHDIDIIESLLMSKLIITIVGDPKQATFRTNENPANKQKCGAYFGAWVVDMKNRGLLIPEYRQISRRFGPMIAKLANKIDPREKQLRGTEQEPRNHQGIFIISINDIDAYLSLSNATCLVLNQTVRKTFSISRNTFNFGECKGMTFNDTLIVCPKPLEKFLVSGNLLTSNIAKYYIAVTRARQSVAFAVRNIDRVQKQHPSWIRWDDPNKDHIREPEQLELL